MPEKGPHSAASYPSMTWVDRPSFTAAATVLFLNVVPVLVIPYLWVLYILILPAELITAAVLLFRRGASRQAGVGVVSGLLASVVSVAVAVAIFAT
ncbi:hypothetical protein [Nocardia gipuzkoensis]|uniref:hypothetical protein n=1 Tax=Nocardia gipuzkoensis TaxID=2749991 RepID=UPI003EE1C19B